MNEQQAAELRAEVERLTALEESRRADVEQWTDRAVFMLGEIARLVAWIDRLRAELAELKARTCRTCAHFTQSRTSCALHGCNVFLPAIGPGEFCCSEWEATE